MRSITTTIKAKDSFKPVVLMIFLCGIILSLAVFYGVRQSEYRVISLNFKIDAENHYSAIKRELESDLQVMDSLYAFYESVGGRGVNRSEFSLFAKHKLMGHGSIQAFEWIPRVQASNRAEYEQSARQEGFPGWEITERLKDGTLVRAGQRKEYYPVYYVEPIKGNETDSGYDSATSPQRWETLQRARDTGTMVSSGKITLTRHRANRYGIIVARPIYNDEALTKTAEARRENLRGFVLGVFSVAEIVDKSLSYVEPTGIDTYIYDNPAPTQSASLSASLSDTQTASLSASLNATFQPKNERYPLSDKASLLYYHPSRKRAGSIYAGSTDARSTYDGKEALSAKDDSAKADEGIIAGTGLTYNLTYAKMLEVAGQHWILQFNAMPGYVSGKRSLQPWAVLFAGLLITLFLTGYVRSMSIVRDMQRRIAEEALINSESKLRMLIEKASDGIHIADEAGYILDANSRICEMLGYTREELLELHLRDIIHPEDILRTPLRFVEFKAGKTLIFERRLLRKDGTSVDTEISAKQLPDGKFMGITRDITERKRIEEAYRKSEENLRALMNAITESVCLMDANGVFLAVNDTFSRRFNKKSHEIVGTNFRDLFKPDIFERRKKYIDEVIHTGGIVSFEDTRDDAHFFSSFYPVFYDDRRVRGVAVYASDISVRKAYEDKLKRSLREKEVLLQEIHHRVKNNLQVVSGLLSLQMEYVADATYREMFMESQNRIRSIAMVHEKLYRSTGFSNIDIKEYVTDLAGALFMNFAIDKKNVKLNLDIGHIPIAIDVAIPCGLIINELFSNVLKHAFPHGLLCLKDGTCEIDIAIRPISSPISTPISAPISSPISSPISTPISAPISAQVSASLPANSGETAPAPGGSEEATAGQTRREVRKEALNEAFNEAPSRIDKPWRSRPCGEMVELIVRDNGVGFPEGVDFRKTRTFGMHIVLALVKQLGGTIELKSLPQHATESASLSASTESASTESASTESATITNSPYGKGTEFLITFRNS